MKLLSKNYWKLIKQLIPGFIGILFLSGVGYAVIQTNTFPDDGNVGIGTLDPNISCGLENGSGVCDAKTLSIVSGPVEPALLELALKVDSAPQASEIGDIRFIQGDTTKYHVAQIGAVAVANPLDGANLYFYTNARLGIVGLIVKANGDSIAIPAIKSTTGTRYVCVGTDGTLSSSVTPCSGT